MADDNQPTSRTPGHSRAHPVSTPAEPRRAALEVRLHGSALRSRADCGRARRGRRAFCTARSEEPSRSTTCSWGFVEVLPDRVTILANDALKPEEIDVPRAQQQLDRGAQDVERSRRQRRSLRRSSPRHRRSRSQTHPPTALRNTRKSTSQTSISHLRPCSPSRASISPAEDATPRIVENYSLHRSCQRDWSKTESSCLALCRDPSL